MKSTNKKTKIAKIAAAVGAVACLGAASMFAACGGAHEHTYGDWQVSEVTNARVTITRTCTDADCTAEDRIETKTLKPLSDSTVWKKTASQTSGNIKYVNEEHNLTYYDWTLEFESVEEDDFVLCTEYSGGYFAACCVQLSGGNGLSATSQNATLSGTVTFIFTAKEAGKATLNLTAASDIQTDTQDATEDYRVSPETGVTVKINDAAYTYRPDTIPGNDAADYEPGSMFELMDPHTITLGEIDLKKGTNKITFIFDGNCHLHLDCIHLLTGVDGSHQFGYYEAE